MTENTIPFDKEAAPYAFNKHIDKSVAAAEIVLGPKAINRILVGLVLNFSDEDQDVNVDSNIAAALHCIAGFIDPKKQIVIKTDDSQPGGLEMYSEDKEAGINNSLHGYTLVDIKTALAVAIRDDLTGFVLQALQIKWERDLTIEDAENITFHLHELIKLLH